MTIREELDAFIERADELIDSKYILADIKIVNLLKAIASDIGPTLPKYIVAMIIILPMLPSEEVRFLVSPTVAVALTVS